MNNKITRILIISLISGVLIALLTYFITNKKTNYCNSYPTCAVTSGYTSHGFPGIFYSEGFCAVYTGLDIACEAPLNIFWINKLLVDILFWGSVLALTLGGFNYARKI